MDLSTDDALTMEDMMQGNPDLHQYLYQLYVDTTNALNNELGIVKYDAKAKVLQGTGQGCQMVFWGSALGCEREGGIIKHDYDLDFWVFLKDGSDAQAFVQRVAARMWTHGYKVKLCTKEEPHLFKVHPAQPHIYGKSGAWKELTYYVKDADPSLDRPGIVQAAAAMQRKGVPAPNPHGIHVADVEIYVLKDGEGEVNTKYLKHVQMADIFPLQEKKFGPKGLYALVPKNSQKMLEAYYGKDCLKKPVLKHPITHKNHPVPRKFWGPALPPKALRRMNVCPRQKL